MSVTSRLDKFGKGLLRWLTRRRQRELTSWAVIAVLFLNIFSAAVLPSLFSSEAAAASLQTEGAGQTEGVGTPQVICTQNGPRLIYLDANVVIDANGEPVPTEGVADDGSCVCCLSHVQSILFAPSAGTIIPEHDHRRVQQTFIRNTDQGVASVSFKPLGSRAPPIYS